MGFTRKIESLPGHPTITTANSSYASTRAVLLEQNVTNGRNIAYNTLQAAGVLMAATTPFFGTGTRWNPKTGAATAVNNARVNWTTIGTIVSGPALSAFNLIAPNPILNQLNNLDDQSFETPSS